MRDGTPFKDRQGKMERFEQWLGKMERFEQWLDSWFWPICVAIPTIAITVKYWDRLRWWFGLTD